MTIDEEWADARRLADEQAVAINAMSPQSSPRTCSGVHQATGRTPAASSFSLSTRWTPEQVRGDEGEIWRRSISEIGRGFAVGTLTPPTLVTALLQRIKAIDGQLNSFVHVDRAGAKTAAEASAARWAAGTPLGPLDGVPVGIKDVIDVAGLPTRCHSRLTSDAPAKDDAAIVALLRAAGAVILGKLATHEFAIGGPAFDLPFPPARNSWNTDHHPGGSSSGAGAAVAAGLVPLAIGTDTAGSVRHPASACGIVGLKPGRGVLSCEGVVPLAPTLDHIGLLTRNAEEMRIAAEALGVPCPAPGRLRVGYVRHFHTGNMVATPDVAAALDRAAATFDASEISLPPLEDFALVNRVILQREGFAVHAEALRARPDAFSALTRKALLPGAFSAAETLTAAYSHQRRLTAAVDAAFADCDILLTASSMEPPCRIDDPQEVARTYMLQARSPFNVTGHPALAMRAGLSVGGLPLSVQFVAPMGGEGALIAVATQWEAAMGGPMTPPNR